MSNKIGFAGVFNPLLLTEGTLEAVKGDIDLDRDFGIASEGYLQHYKNEKYLNEMKYAHLTKKEREAIIVDIRRTPKINRNDMCICGSGKKFKKCCIKK